MKLALLTTLACNAAVVITAENGVRGLTKQIFGSSEFANVESDAEAEDVFAHCVGCQPDYCYDGDVDWDCYKDGYPKCCTKNKGNCPNNNKPTCECQGSCNPDYPYECDYFGVGDDNCPRSSLFCQIPVGDCRKKSASQAGECMPVTYACPMNIDEVCGCDGVTYNNECIAYSEGVNVESRGAC